MHAVRQMNPTLYIRARQKQTELWDRIIAAMSGEWEQGWSRRWRLDPKISLDEVMEDLQCGRD